MPNTKNALPNNVQFKESAHSKESIHVKGITHKFPWVFSLLPIIFSTYIIFFTFIQNMRDKIFFPPLKSKVSSKFLSVHEMRTNLCMLIFKPKVIANNSHVNIQSWSCSKHPHLLTWYVWALDASMFFYWFTHCFYFYIVFGYNPYTHHTKACLFGSLGSKLKMVVNKPLSLTPLA